MLLEKVPFKSGTQLVIRLTNNAGKNNSKLNSTARLMTQAVGEMLLQVFLAIWQITNVGGKEWTISPVKSMILNVGRNLFQTFLVIPIISNVGKPLLFTNSRNQQINFLKKLKKVNNLSNKKLNKLKRVQLVKKLERLKSMSVKR